MKRPLCVVCLAVVACIAVKLWLYPPPQAVFGEANQGQVCLVGQVYAKEFKRGYDGPILLLYVEPSELIYQNQSIPLYENFICRMQEGGMEPAIGSQVWLMGTLQEFESATNPGQFDERLYYATLGVSAQINKAVVVKEESAWDLREGLWQLRKMLGEKLDSIFEEEDAAILRAMLLGDKSGLPAKTKEIYKESGILHILAISGLHISVLGMGLYKGLVRIYVPRKLTVILCAIIMLLYGMMVGMPVSAVRAIIMFLFRLAAEWKGRTYDMLTALAIGAVLLLLEQPLYLLNAGFLLSFTAVAAVGILKPLLMPPMEKAQISLQGVVGTLDGLITSLSISVFSLPVQLYYYCEISVYAPLFNLLVLPLVGAILAAGLGAIPTMWLFPFLARALALFVHWVLTAYKWGGDVVRNLTGAIWTPGQPDYWQIIVYYFLLGIVVALKKLCWRFRVGLICGAVLILTFSCPQGLTVTMLDVGQGDCICLELPDGTIWLVDGGSTDVGKVGTYRIEPFLKSQGIRTLDAVFLSHGDSDHVNGVEEILENRDIAVKLLVLPCVEAELAYTTESGFCELVLLAKQRQIPILWLEAGMEWENAGVKVKCLHPSKEDGLDDTTDSNAGSEVLYLTYKNFSMLLTGDVEGAGEDALVEALQENGIEQVTVLKVAHHGSRYSTSEALLQEIRPVVSLISCGENNSYGHPHEETLKRLSESGSMILTTPECGAVVIEIGEEIRIKK